MSDRSHVLPAPEGEFFENSRFNGLSLICGAGRNRRARPQLCRRLPFAGAVQLFLALRFLLFLHPLHRVPLLDDCAPRGRCGMVGRRPAPAREHRAPSAGAWACSFCPIWFWRKYLYRWMDIPLGVDPAPRCQARLSELGILPHPRGLLLRRAHARGLSAAPVLRPPGSRRQPAFHSARCGSSPSSACRFSRFVSPSARSTG